MLTFYEKARAAELVARACRVLGKQEMTYGALGHISYRLDGERMLIKGKGPDESALTFTEPKDIIEIDFNGDPVDAPKGLRPPSECFIHIQIMKKYPEVQSVIHCHPEHAILMTIVGREILPIYGSSRPGGRMGLGGIPTYPRSRTVTTPEMGDALVDMMGESKAVLMRSHGITTYGSSVQDATVRALAVDQLLTMTYKAYLLGDPRPLPDDDLAELRSGPREPRTRGSAGGEGSMLATWRYNCRLCDEDPS